MECEKIKKESENVEGANSGENENIEETYTECVGSIQKRNGSASAERSEE